MNQRFGPYRVGETVGRGTFAKVKIAVHETTKTKVALKVISRKMMEQDERSNVKIRREIKILKLLRHPNIMRLFDVVQTKHDIVLILEYVSGGELFDYISYKGHLDEPTARHFFQQLVAGVAYCHRYRVTHRDLKPENIMIESQTKTLKIGDFGLSSITHDGRFFETSCGTPNYASPEVVSGKLYGGPETDVWSCGVVLYTMLVGALPFDDQHISVLFKKIQTADYVMPSSLSAEAQDILRRMIVVNALERATIEQVMQHPWLRPSFPPYLLSLHYSAILETMRFAKYALVKDEMFDEEIIGIVASYFRMSPQRVAAIIASEEEKKPSMHKITYTDTQGCEKVRRYPAAVYFETYANVIDAKLWPTPLTIPPAEQALRNEEHDVFVSYQLLSQRKQSKRTPEQFSSKASFSYSESAGSYLLSQSLQGYGSLNANLLHQYQPGATSLGMSLSSAASKPADRQSTGRKHGNLSFSTLPTHGSPSSNTNNSDEVPDPFMENYNRLYEPFLPLVKQETTSTLLGKLLGVLEAPSPVQTTRNINISLKRFSSDPVGPNAGVQSPLLKPQGEGNLLKPAGGTLLQPSALESAAGGEDAALRGMRTTAFEALYDVETVARFGNDFMRHGVLFYSTDANRTMKSVYKAMAAEGLLWKVIHPFYLSCVKHPNTKIQVKLYRDGPQRQLVDVKVSCQSGMTAFDCAMRLLDRLRVCAVAHNRQGSRLQPVVAPEGFEPPHLMAGSPNERTLVREGHRTVGGFPSVPNPSN